jgi:hypothetical protein
MTTPETAKGLPLEPTKASKILIANGLSTPLATLSLFLIFERYRLRWRKCGSKVCCLSTDFFMDNFEENGAARRFQFAPNILVPKPIFGLRSPEIQSTLLPSKCGERQDRCLNHNN